LGAVGVVVGGAAEYANIETIHVILDTRYKILGVRMGLWTYTNGIDVDDKEQRRAGRRQAQRKQGASAAIQQQRLQYSSQTTVLGGACRA
jgi:hypothetical protein